MYTIMDEKKVKLKNGGSMRQQKTFGERVSNVETRALRRRRSKSSQDPDVAGE